MIVRHQLLTELVKLWKKGKLVEEVDRLPIELSPRKREVLGRCCIYKERAVWKYKSLPLLGWDMSDEKDELTRLSTYAEKALEREQVAKDNLLCVIDVACSSCLQQNYVVSDLCQGCVARPCQVNCPKDAVRFNKRGRAEIDTNLCVNCGICYQNCPYHAIVYLPIPCEESCPVGAIKKDEDGVETIDESKCIYCGKCLLACPFGAIFEISHTFDVLQRIRENEKVIAIVAPAILGQFNAPIENVYGAIKAMGFYDVVEVAQGAMMTTSHEAEELKEKIASGQPFMTTSCCPSYIELTEKHIPEMKPFVSHTPSPMNYTAQMVKDEHPDATIVFIGPCVAKRKEARKDANVDFVITFEEINSILEGMDIEVESAKTYAVQLSAVREAHGFAKAGGVTGAVKAYLKSEANDIKTVEIFDINKKNIALLRSFAKKKNADGQFVEVMACAGGCITGPVVHNGVKSARRQLERELVKIPGYEDTH